MPVAAVESWRGRRGGEGGGGVVGSVFLSSGGLVVTQGHAESKQDVLNRILSSSAHSHVKKADVCRRWTSCSESSPPMAPQRGNHVKPSASLVLIAVIWMRRELRRKLRHHANSTQHKRPSPIPPPSLASKYPAAKYVKTKWCHAIYTASPASVCVYVHTPPTPPLTCTW